MFEYERTWHVMQIPGIVCTTNVPYILFYSSAGQWDQTILIGLLTYLSYNNKLSNNMKHSI